MKPIVREVVRVKKQPTEPLPLRDPPTKTVQIISSQDKQINSEDSVLTHRNTSELTLKAGGGICQRRLSVNSIENMLVVDKRQMETNP
ncbi:hypothetical protein ACUWCL_29125, partial [Klebsiella pneumoniae]|uniref:hypothetical protein n=1 Tax=Klebsiella pneumoniae TaxID=573 RepID=UPI00405566AB